jgi:hypothetical protein
MKIIKLLMLLETGYKYKDRWRIISDTNEAIIVSYENYDSK